MTDSPVLFFQSLDFKAEIEKDPRLKSVHTRRQYAQDLGHFESWRAGRMITKTLVEEYLAQLQRASYSPSSINTVLCAIRWWIRRIADKAFEEHPEMGAQIQALADRTTTVKGVRGSRLPAGRHIEQWELEALIQSCLADPSPAGARDAALIAVAASTGGRAFELRDLHIDDLDYIPGEGAQILIRHGKGDKERLAYLTESTFKAVDAWLGFRSALPGPLFNPIRKNGTVVVEQKIKSHEAMRLILRRRFMASNLAQHTTWHDFRHTFIGQLLDNGADLATVQALAGHASPRTTAAYDRRPDEVRRQAVQTLEIPYKRIEEV